MKVYEIITPQQQLDEFSLNPLTWFGGSAGNAAAQAATNAKAAKAAADAAKATGASPDLLKLFNQISTDGALGARKASAAAWAEKLGHWSIILKILTLFAVCAELVYHLEVTERMYQNNEIKTEKQFKDARRAFFGIWEVQFFLPWLATMLANTRIVRIFAQLIFGVATLGVGFFTGGVGAILGITLETAAFEALEVFLHSDTFKKWLLSPAVLPTLIEMGTIPDVAWNELRKLVSEIPIINTFMKNQGKDYYDSEKENKRQTNPSAVAADELGGTGKLNGPATAAPNAVNIDGVNVVKADGTLDDWAMMRSNVQNYISLHPDDPAVKKLSSIPRAPGSVY
jgi:hypothetical protein